MNSLQIIYSFLVFLPKWDSVESDKKKLIQQIDVLNAKITKLQEKRNKFLEEIDDSLKSLKERLKRLKGELAKDNLLFLVFFLHGIPLNQTRKS